jgi:hypothetical protein
MAWTEGICQDSMPFSIDSLVRSTRRINMPWTAEYKGQMDSADILKLRSMKNLPGRSIITDCDYCRVLLLDEFPACVLLFHWIGADGTRALQKQLAWKFRRKESH